MADYDESAAPAEPERAQYYHDCLTEYRRAIEDKWSRQRENLDRLYSRDGRADSADREYSLFWANIEVLRGAVYSRPPAPVVVPRHRKSDPLAIAASETLERSLITTFSRSDLDGCMQEVRDEFLRYARGTPWVRLGVDHNGTAQVEYDHVTACDFAHDPARTWREVKWVARRAWMTRDEGIKRFGPEFAAVPLKNRDNKTGNDDGTDQQAPVWEFWRRDKRIVVWIAEDHDQVLDQRPPWLDLTGFWPCPKPACGTLVPGKLKPIPDVLQYKDQLEEINTYTARIAALSEQLRLKGFFPAGESELGDAIEAALKSVENRAILIPISSWGAFGGVAPKDTIVWLPVADVLAVIQGLVELRRVVIQDVYEITGISDIVRGQSEASETATAQQLKSQWGSVRIKTRQSELARVARDLTRLSAEIIAENFPPDVIVEMAQTELPTQVQKQQAQAQVMAAQQQAQATGQQPQPVPPDVRDMLKQPAQEDVLAFLRNDRARSFSIDIETDSTIQPDEDADKQRRIEFVTAIGNLFKQAAPILMQAPPLAPFFGEVLRFTAQGFRAGRTLEGAIDQLTQTLNQMAAMAGQPKQPDPTEQVKLQTAQVKGQAEVARANASLQQMQMETQQSVLEHQMAMREMAAQAMLPQQPVINGSGRPQGY